MNYVMRSMVRPIDGFLGYRPCDRLDIMSPSLLETPDIHAK